MGIFQRKKVPLMMCLMQMSKYLMEMKFLSAAVDALRSSEDSIYRNQDYRDRLDSTSKEYGPGSLYWDAESKTWKISDGYKLESPAGLKDPFDDESKFPFRDIKPGGRNHFERRSSPSTITNCHRYVL